MFESRDGGYIEGCTKKGINVIIKDFMHLLDIKQLKVQVLLMRNLKIKNLMVKQNVIFRQW